MRLLAVHPSALMYTRVYLRLEPLGLELVAAAARAAGHDVRLTEYPNAAHSFDNPLFPLAVVAGGQSVRGCAIREEPMGKLINAVTKQAFTYKDPCVQLDPHSGYDAAASAAARVAVRSFLKSLFKLD